MDESVYERAQAATERATAAAVASVVERPAEPSRLDAGGQRICLECGEPIPAERLRAWPRAVRCVECQDNHERRAERV